MIAISPSQSNPITQIDPDAPYPIGAIVNLRCAPAKQYTVLDVQEDVDLSDTSGHIKNPSGGRQHHYKLRSGSGNVAHWWHHQVELSF